MRLCQALKILHASLKGLEMPTGLHGLPKSADATG